jgi:ribosomal protein S18 acetylase RimI-like enzyme
LESFLIREFEAGDESALRACVIELQNAEREIFSRTAEGKTVANTYIAYLKEVCRANKGKIIVAEVDGQTVGYSAVQIWNNSEEVHEEAFEYGYISDLAVLDSHRGHGLGRALLAAAEAYVKAQYIDYLRIGVLAGNGRVRRMYQSYGFHEHKLVFEKRL